MQKTIFRIVAALMVLGLLLGAIGPAMVLLGSQQETNVEDQSEIQVETVTQEVSTETAD